jgi:hypothetical protein
MGSCPFLALLRKTTGGSGRDLWVRRDARCSAVGRSSAQGRSGYGRGGVRRAFVAWGGPAAAAAWGARLLGRRCALQPPGAAVFFVWQRRWWPGPAACGWAARAARDAAEQAGEAALSKRGYLGHVIAFCQSGEEVGERVDCRGAPFLPEHSQKSSGSPLFQFAASPSPSAPPPRSGGLPLCPPPAPNPPQRPFSYKLPISSSSATRITSSRQQAPPLARVRPVSLRGCRDASDATAPRGSCRPVLPDDDRWQCCG